MAQASYSNAGDADGLNDLGDLGDLAVLWMRAQPAVNAFVSSGVRDIHGAEEVLQEIAATVVHKFQEYDSSRPFNAWVLGIARLKVLEFLRKRSNDRHVFNSDTLSLLAEAHQQTISTYTPRKQALGECLNELKGKNRQIIEMRYLRDIKPMQIADRMGMSRNAVFILLHRMRIALAKCIERRLALQGGRGS